MSAVTRIYGTYLEQTVLWRSETKKEDRVLGRYFRQAPNILRSLNPSAVPIMCSPQTVYVDLQKKFLLVVVTGRLPMVPVDGPYPRAYVDSTS